MYHPAVVQRRIETALAAKEVFYELPVGDGRTVKRYFEPTPHSVSEVDSSVRHLDSLRDPEGGKLSRPLDEAEIAFIANERFLCRLDYLYYATRFARIKNEKGIEVRYSPRIAQRIFQDIIGEHDLNDWPIELQVGKARQLGMSRETSLMFGHRAIFWSGTNAVLASADPEKSSKLTEMMKYPIDRLPWWLAPTPTYERRGEYIIYADQDSSITIEAGNQFNGLARGTTPQLVHLSEVCEFEEPEELIEAALFPAIHPSRWTFLVLESTALGRGNWWHDTWKKGKADWKAGRARLRPVFLPWFVGSDIYPTEDWKLMHRHHIAAYQPAQYVLDHARAAEVYAHTDPLLSKYLGPNWRMSKEQMFWYETTRDEYNEKGNLNRFLAEYASSDVEMFQSTNISVFPYEVVSRYRDLARGKQPLGVFGLQTSEDIFPKRLQPAERDIDHDAPAIDITWPWGGTSGRDLNFTLVPLKWEGYGEKDEDGNGKIFIFEMPDGRSDYGIGVDTGEGVGTDRSTNEVMRKGNIFARGAQVAEYASAYVNSLHLWPITAALTALYATPFGGRLKQPRVAIECRGNGDTVQIELVKRGLYNWHPWVRIDSKNIQPGKAHKMGVFTNNWFRKQVMDWLLSFLNDEKMEINSPYFVNEMESLEADEWSQSMKAAYNEHDDRLMAMGFIIVSLHQLEIMRGQRPEDQNVQKDEDPVWTPPDLSLHQGQQQFLAKLNAGRFGVARPASARGVTQRYG
jgi:hypothetical protein